MRFMMLMIPQGYQSAPPGTLPDAAAVSKMMKYNMSLGKAGILLDLNGLQPPSVGGARITFKSGKPVVTDGPFTETKETVGGYWIIEVKSRAEAVEWASRCPASEHETIEVRQVFDVSDFGPDVQAAVSEFPETRAAAAVQTLKDKA
jgi:hypothetical protein